MLFADLTTTYFSHKNVQELYNAVNHDLEALKCLTEGKLFLNIGKIKYIIFSRKTRKQEQSNIMYLRIGAEPMERKKSSKFPGIFIDDTLDWEEHVKYS